MDTYYDILEITESASQDTITEAWREKTRKHHPDTGTGDQDAYQQVVNAGKVLRDEGKRDAYDTLGHEKFIRMYGERGQDRPADGGVQQSGTDTNETAASSDTESQSDAADGTGTTSTTSHETRTERTTGSTGPSDSTRGKASPTESNGTGTNSRANTRTATETHRGTTASTATGTKSTTKTNSESTSSSTKQDTAQTGIQIHKTAASVLSQWLRTGVRTTTREARTGVISTTAGVLFGPLFVALGAGLLSLNDLGNNYPELAPYLPSNLALADPSVTLAIEVTLLIFALLAARVLALTLAQSDMALIRDSVRAPLLMLFIPAVLFITATGLYLNQHGLVSLTTPYWFPAEDPGITIAAAYLSLVVVNRSQCVVFGSGLLTDRRSDTRDTVLYTVETAFRRAFGFASWAVISALLLSIFATTVSYTTAALPMSPAITPATFTLIPPVEVTVPFLLVVGAVALTSTFAYRTVLTAYTAVHVR